MTKNKNKKKSLATSVSQSDTERAQSLFEQYHEIAQALRQSSDQQQAEAALESIAREAEAAQIALLKALARTTDTDAADVLLALNLLSPLKNVRKEARRCLLQLEQSNISPRWQPPIERTSALETIQETGNAPRFWKGYVTNSRDVGEISMLLMWEQGEDYRDVRTVGLLLEFWHDGVKDFFTYVESKRRAQKTIDETIQAGEFVPCSLAKAKRLIQEALDVNKKAHTTPYRDYRLNISLVNNLIVEAPDTGEDEEDEGDESETALDLKQLTPMNVITTFVDAWADQNYTLAYDLLASSSPLREGIAREEWVAQRENWAEEAHPQRVRPGLIREHKAPKTNIWLPNPLKRRASTTEDYEAGWSIELAEPAYIEALPELPKPTISYQGTGRHWFWGTYGVIREEGSWRILTITDEGSQIRLLPTAQIEKIIENLGVEAEKISQKTPRGTKTPEEAVLDNLTEVIALLNTTLFYDDILVAKPDAEAETLKDAYLRAELLGNFERGVAYIDRYMERFPEENDETLIVRAAAQLSCRERYYSEDDDEADQRIQRLEELAEADLRESLRLNERATAHLTLADLLYDTGEEDRLDEAVSHLHAAQALEPTPEETTIIENLLGEIATDREQYAEALQHYQQVAEIDPEFEEIWNRIGETQLDLKKNEDAEASFKKSIELHPSDMQAHSELVRLYLSDQHFTEARELIEQGLLANPDSAYLLALLAEVYFDSGDPEQADEILKEAEEIAPDLPIVKAYRQSMDQIAQEREQAKR